MGEGVSGVQYRRYHPQRCLSSPGTVSRKLFASHRTYLDIEICYSTRVLKGVALEHMGGVDSIESIPLSC